MSGFCVSWLPQSKAASKQLDFLHDNSRPKQECYIISLLAHSVGHTSTLIQEAKTQIYCRQNAKKKKTKQGHILKHPKVSHEELIHESRGKNKPKSLSRKHILTFEKGKIKSDCLSIVRSEQQAEVIFFFRIFYTIEQTITNLDPILSSKKLLGNIGQKHCLVHISSITFLWQPQN